NDPLPTDMLAPLDEVVVNARAAVVAPTAGERGMQQDFEPSVFLAPWRFGSGAARIEPARRHAEPPTELPDGVMGPLRLDRGEGYAWCLAKRAETFFSRSRSMRSSRFSLRNRVNSSRSSFVSPLLPFVRSAWACRTQRLSAEAVRSNSRATAPTALPSSRTNRTAPSLNSSENRRRARRPPLPDRIRDIVSTFRNVSTETDQAQQVLAEPSHGVSYPCPRAIRLPLENADHLIAVSYGELV